MIVNERDATCTHEASVRELLRRAYRLVLSDTVDCRRAETEFARLAEEELLLARAKSECGLRTKAIAMRVQ